MIQPHIQLDRVMGAQCALLPGDPARLDRIAAELEQVQPLACNREYRSLVGLYKGLPVLALSTGIGGCSAGIAVEELARIGVDAMVRIGSCGALRPGIALGDLILACGAVRDDGASQAYVDLRYPAVPDTDLLCHCRDAAASFGWTAHLGLVHSHESFYIDDNAAQEAAWAARGVLCADMETAALLTIGRLRGIRAASILNNVVPFGEDTAEAVGDYAGGAGLTVQGERREIVTALEALYRLKGGV